MKNTIKLLSLMLLSIIVLGTLAAGCKPKQQAVTAGVIPPGNVTASEIAFSQEGIKDIDAKLGKEYKDDEIADYSKMINTAVKADRITASSYLESNSRTLSYKPENVNDFDFQNAWVEGVEGVGIGEYIALHFGGTAPEINKVVIANGYVKSEKTYRENSRPKKLKMYVDDKPYAVLNLHDIRGEQIFTFAPTPIAGRTLKFKILEVYQGTLYEDTSISEIYFNELPPPAAASSGAFDGVLRAQVENGGELNALISEFRVSGFYEITLSGTYANGGFTVTLPETPDANVLPALGDYFYADGIVSDKNARWYDFMWIKGYDRNGTHIATFSQYDDSTLIPLYHEGELVEMGGYKSIAYFYYVDRDVTINGGFEGQGYDLDLKKGWNNVYAKWFEPNGRMDCTTTKPSDWPESKVKWQFEKIEG